MAWTASMAALKSVASFSSCRPSSPDIACHHTISVAALAAEPAKTAMVSPRSSLRSPRVRVAPSPFRTGFILEVRMIGSSFKASGRGIDYVLG